jgi:hypothetical protein
MPSSRCPASFAREAGLFIGEFASLARGENSGRSRRRVAALPLLLTLSAAARDDLGMTTTHETVHAARVREAAEVAAAVRGIHVEADPPSGLGWTITAGTVEFVVERHTARTLGAWCATADDAVPAFTAPTLLALAKLIARDMDRDPPFTDALGYARGRDY